MHLKRSVFLDSAFHWLQSQQSCSYARAALELAPPPMADELSGDTKRKLSDQGRSLLMASMQLQKQAAAAAVAPESGTSFEATTVTLQRIEGEGLGLLMDREGDPPNMQTADITDLPGGYGQGSSSLAGWIQQNLDRDAQQAKWPIQIQQQGGDK